MFVKSSAVLVSLAASAMATVFVTNPTATTTCNAGQSCSIEWRDDNNAPSLQDFGVSRVSIYAGNARAQTLLQPISDSVNVATTAAIQFNPDPSIGPSGGFYFVRFESLSARDPTDATLPALSFSARFNLQGMTGQFNKTVQDQVDGLATAPLAGSTATVTSSSSTTRLTTTTTSKSTTGSPTNSAGAAGANAASSVMVNGVTATFAIIAAAVMGFAL